MDLIYMNADKEDIGVLQEYELDLEIGGENDFECTLASKSHCCHEGYFLYIEGTEYGGVIDGIKSDTGTQDVTYSGRTWHGILGSKVILPLQSTDASTSSVTLKTADSKGASLVNRYLIVSGDANACIQYIIDRAGLSDMFAAPGNVSGFNINQYQFHRYIDAYDGLQKMLASAGLKLHLEYRGGKVIVSANERFDYSKDDSFDSDMLDFRVAKKYKTVNHLICLGAGELEKRTVIHLYADTKGNISQTQTQFGFDEYSAVYDFSAVESAEELLRYGTDELKSLWKQDELSIDFDESMDAYDVGDIVGAVDIVTGVAISSVITKKIVTIKNGKISIDLSTDNVSATGSGATGDGEVPRDVVAVPAYNLLDNSDFQIAQAGYPGQHGSTWFVADRWEAEQRPNAVMYDNRFAFNANDGGQLVVIQKTTEKVAAKLIGKTITLVACTDAGEILCASGTVVYDQPVAQVVYGADWSLQLHFFQSSGSYQLARFIVNAGKTANIKWVALYEGEYTAENLPPYVPKDYAAEYMECCRYYRPLDGYGLGNGYTTDGSNFVCIVNTGVPMRITPTFACDGTVYCRCGGDAEVTLNGVFMGDRGNASVVRLSFTYVNGTAPVFSPAAFYTTGHASLCADL